MTRRKFLSTVSATALLGALPFSSTMLKRCMAGGCVVLPTEKARFVDQP